MILSNFHTHTKFSDGKKDAHEYCLKAIELGFHSLGFSDHAPVPFHNSFSIEPDQLDSYFKTIESLKTTYQDHLKIFLSLEADYIPHHSYTFEHFRKMANLDYMIGSIHLVYNHENQQLWFIDGGDQDVWDQGLKTVFGGHIQKAVAAFYHQNNEMILNQKPEVIGHFDKIKMHNKDRFFSQNESWYQNFARETLKLIKENDIVLEINTRGLYKGRCKELFPSVNIILEAQKMGIPMMLNSDAHHPDELAGAFPEALEILKKIGLKELFEFTDKGWKGFGIES